MILFWENIPYSALGYKIKNIPNSKVIFVSKILFYSDLKLYEKIFSKSY